MKNNFYVTSYSAGIGYGCVTPFSYRNAVEHKSNSNTNTQSTMQGPVFLCIRGAYCSIVFTPGRINTWFEIETGVAIHTAAEGIHNPACVSAVQAGKMSYVQKPVIKK